MEANLTTVIIFSTIGGLLSLSFAVFLLIKKSGAKAMAIYATPFAAGALLASAFFDLIPEGSELSSVTSMMRWTLLGLLSFFVLESLLGWFHHHHEHTDGREASTVSLIVFGDTVHNFIDGLAIAAAFLVDTSTGYITTLAVSLHEIPQEIGDFGLLLNKGLAKRKILFLNITSATATIFGAIIFFQLGANSSLDTTWLLGVTAGFFIYIAASDIIPGIHSGNNRKRLVLQTVLVLLGILTVWGVTSLTENLPKDTSVTETIVEQEPLVVEEPEIVLEKPKSETKFFVIGDTGNGSWEQIKIAKYIDSQSFDAVIHTGDLAYNSGKTNEIIENYQNIYSKKIRDNLWPTIGNHDNATNNAAPYIKYFNLPKQALNSKDNERYYSVDVGNAHLISIDTNTALNEISLNRDDDMADWLEKDLQNADASKAIIVFMHEPPFNTGKHPPKELVQELLTPLFDKYGVDLVLGGHDHNYQRTCLLLFSTNGTKCQKKGVPYIVSGGAGRGLYDINTIQKHFIVATSQHNYLIVKVDQDGKVSLTAYDINNKSIDSVKYINRN